jgi:hypothetical protein
VADGGLGIGRSLPRCWLGVSSSARRRFLGTPLRTHRLYVRCVTADIRYVNGRNVQRRYVKHGAERWPARGRAEPWENRVRERSNGVLDGSGGTALPLAPGGNFECSSTVGAIAGTPAAAVSAPVRHVELCSCALTPTDADISKLYHRRAFSTRCAKRRGVSL